MTGDAAPEAGLAAAIEALADAFTGLEFEENAAAASQEAEWSWFRWLAISTVAALAAARNQPEAADDTLAERVAAVLLEHGSERLFRRDDGVWESKCGCGHLHLTGEDTIDPARAMRLHRAHVAAAIVASLGDS